MRDSQEVICRKTNLVVGVRESKLNDATLVDSEYSRYRQHAVPQHRRAIDILTFFKLPIDTALRSFERDSKGHCCLSVAVRQQRIIKPRDIFLGLHLQALEQQLGPIATQKQNINTQLTNLWDDVTHFGKVGIAIRTPAAAESQQHNRTLQFLRIKVERFAIHSLDEESRRLISLAKRLDQIS